MLAGYDWRLRHAGLMAIAAIGEGTSKECVSRFSLWCDLVGGLLTRVGYRLCRTSLGKS